MTLYRVAWHTLSLNLFGLCACTAASELGQQSSATDEAQTPDHPADPEEAPQSSSGGSTKGDDPVNPATGGSQSENSGGSSSVGEPELPVRSTNYGNLSIHAHKLGIYMVPDLPSEYLDWDKTERSLRKLHGLLPSAWIRWDNETGHQTDTPENVERFVQAAQQAEIKMIITASAVDGYDNWWARGNSQPTVSIREIADGPYLTFAHQLLHNYSNVQLIETINEPDTIWFVADPDNVENWRHYMDKLYAATENHIDEIVGPSAAFQESNIWNDTAAREELKHFSYHTYSGFEGLREVGSKKVYVTEYGFELPELERDSPAQILADLMQVERSSKLDGSIEMIFYVHLQTMMQAAETENDHFSFSGLLRTLMAYQALSNLSERAFFNEADPQFLATDNEHGHFSLLAWNRNPTDALTSRVFDVPSSLKEGTPLWILRIENRNSKAATCTLYQGEDRISVSIIEGRATVTVHQIPPLEAVFVSTEPCDALAN